MYLKNISIILLFSFLLLSQLFGFSTHNTSISRTSDRSTTFIEDSIFLTVTFNNLEAQTLRGFYYVEYLPPGLSVQTKSIEIYGSPVTNYILESGQADELYPNYIAYRWILETPVTFPQSNPLPASRQLKIVYNISTNIAGEYALNEFHWSGYYESAHAAFGHSENPDSLTIRFNPFTSVNRLDIDRKIKDFKNGQVSEQEVKGAINQYMEKE